MVFPMAPLAAVGCGCPEGCSHDAQGSRSPRANQASRWCYSERCWGILRLEAEIGDENGCGFHEGPIVDERVDQGRAAGCRGGLRAHCSHHTEEPKCGWAGSTITGNCKIV